jgi:hypothetical protein
MSKETYLPDGRLGHSISCDGSAVGMNVCFEKAGELCKGRGYDLVSREGQVVPLRADALVWLLNRETRPDWKT